MGTINATKLIRELKNSIFVDRVRKRTYAGGNVSGRLIEFRHGNYDCQVNLIANGRVQVLLGRVVTGVPKGGWISGDWVAFGSSPAVCPELGTSYAEQPKEGFFTKCFRHKEVPEDVARCIMSRTAVSECLPRIQLRPDELLVFTPDYVVLNLCDRPEDAILQAFKAISQLAADFPLAPQEDIDPDDPTD